MLNMDCLCSTCKSCQITKKDHTHKKYGLLPTKIVESGTQSLGYSLCVSGGSTPFTIRTPVKTYSLLALTMIDTATGSFEIVKATNKSATSIQDLFHNSWLACYPRFQFIVFDNGNMIELKRYFKQISVKNNTGNNSKLTSSHKSRPVKHK
jgi:hypothetical protein